MGRPRWSSTTRSGRAIPLAASLLRLRQDRGDEVAPAAEHPARAHHQRRGAAGEHAPLALELAAAILRGGRGRVVLPIGAAAVPGEDVVGRDVDEPEAALFAGLRAGARARRRSRASAAAGSRSQRSTWVMAAAFTTTSGGDQTLRGSARGASRSAMSSSGRSPAAAISQPGSAASCALQRVPELPAAAGDDPSRAHGLRLTRRLR